VTLPATIATIAAAAAEHVDQRGEAALADGYAVFTTASERYSLVDSVRVDRAGLAEALDWLDESLGRTALKAERLLYACEIRVIAQRWTRNAIADAEFHGESSQHYRWDLSGDAGRDWDTTMSLPAEREAIAARDRARCRLASANAQPLLSSVALLLRPEVK
jgi:hypothetical protein